MTLQIAAFAVALAGLQLAIVRMFLDRMWAMQDKQFQAMDKHLDHQSGRLEDLSRRVTRVEVYAAKAAQMVLPKALALGDDGH